MINRDYNFIFIHVIKTAGTSIHNTFGGKPQHLSILDVINKRPDIALEDYFKFTVIRNPWDKMISQFHYNRKKFIDTDSFDEYIKYMYDGNKISTFNPRHLPWFVDASGRILIDYFVKYEELQQGINHVCDVVGCPKLKLKHKNSTKKHRKFSHYTDYYNNDTMKMVEEFFKDDIEYFGFKFGE